MSLAVSETAYPPVSQVLASVPDVRVEPDARQQIRAWHDETGRRIAVLDDDPTGSQSVHDVSVVTVFDDDEYAAALDRAGATCFVLTNTRSLSEPAAVQLTGSVARSLFELADHLGAPVDVISRSDSTLRGHVVAEVRAVDEARRRTTGHGHDGVLFVPSYFEGGRFTADDIQWARVGGEIVPVGETEFAADATFGYRASNLRQFLEERSGGAVNASDVRSISLSDIRTGGPHRVAEILKGVTDGAFVIVNATEYADLEVFVLGLVEADRAGRRFMYRTGPSFVRALAGLEPHPPLTTGGVWPSGHPGGHGLVVVGSHMGLTSRQVEMARRQGGLAEVEVDVATLLDPHRRHRHIEEASSQVVSALATSDVVLFTSRALVRGADAEDSLQIARTVSAAVTDVVRESLTARPSWVIAKGGITSHDVAVRGLGIRRATVLGQLLPGIVSVYRPVEASPPAVGVPYVVFPGNVGDETTLAHVISIFTGSK